MSRSNSSCRTAEPSRLLTVAGLVQAGGALQLSLVLVLLITNGGAG
jgi:hypothetical protein